MTKCDVLLKTGENATINTEMRLTRQLREENMHQRFGILLLLFVSVSVFASGCTSTAVFTYHPSEKTIVQQKPAPRLRVGVTPLIDARGRDNTSHLYLCVLPTVLFCSVSYDRPEAAKGFLFQNGFQFNPSDDFASAVADELRQTGLFEDVVFPWHVDGPPVDLVVTGTLYESAYYGKNFAYAVSIWSPILWYVGLPAGVVHNTVSLSVQMKRRSDSVIVWSHEIKGEKSATLGFYYNWKADFAGYGTILKSGLREGMEKLRSSYHPQAPS